MHCGHLTGTTTKNVLRCLKFTAYEDLGEEVQDLYDAIGFQVERRNVDSMTSNKLKKAYKALGYPGNTTLEAMHDMVYRTLPHDSLVFERIVRSWCMASIKSKSKAVRTAFRCGRLAETQIEGSIAHFIFHHSNETVAITNIMNVGLLRSHSTLIAAVSPDGIAILRCTHLDTFSDSTKLGQIVSSSDSINVDVENGLLFICSMEYKHKSTLITSNKAKNIVSEHMAGK